MERTNGMSEESLKSFIKKLKKSDQFVVFPRLFDIPLGIVLERIALGKRVSFKDLGSLIDYLVSHVEKTSLNFSVDPLKERENKKC
jgi:hypothetical protein